MTIENFSPTAVYSFINDQLANIVGSIDIEHTDTETQKIVESTREELSRIQSEMNAQLSELEKNSEWDTFTIAFYGETGAGKSTLIETLRILLDEPTKSETQQMFKQMKKRYDNCKVKLANLEKQIKDIECEVLTLDSEYCRLSEEHQASKDHVVAGIKAIEERVFGERTELNKQIDKSVEARSEIETQREALNSRINELKAQASLFKKLILLFKKLPEEEDLSALNAPLSNLVKDTERLQNVLQEKERQSRNEIEKHHSQIHAINEAYNSSISALDEKKVKAAQKASESLQEKHDLDAQKKAFKEELLLNADGEIIGDGRADFTRETQRYDFNLNDKSFALLDVPGIEGKEGLVLSEIERSLQTAHAVLYVTNKAAPPQTGDDQTIGTLEKIKLHLGSQTEVWSIFNKKITNPKFTLKTRSLVGEDEAESLVGLDRKMSEHLGSNYKEVLALSALPAFIVSTDHFVPGGRNAKLREKFLKDFSEHELLEKSQLNTFLDVLNEKVLNDPPSKINQANLNKANAALGGVIEALNEREQSFDQLSKKIEITQESSLGQLHRSFQSLQLRLDSNGEQLIRAFVSQVRDQVYDEIESDIKNDRFKRVLERTIDRELGKLTTKLPNMISEQVKRFEHDTCDILKRFEEQTNELADMSQNMGQSAFNVSFNPKISLTSGVNKLALFTSLLGVAIAPFTGGASLWFAIGSGITALIAVGKALASAFSSSYKKSQQRQSTDENLREVQSELRASLESSLKQGVPEMKKVITQLDHAIAAPLQTIQLTQTLIKESNTQMRAISDQIRSIGAVK
ncbi:hypothetical protein BCT26_11535 [Vibrio lentus]|uniref:DUF726 domain-containing protein n=1 Tax=Vibrio lentus TaxID=136468 RepID=UPI000C84902A|nr:DUF726 domain-containing protein [Vibrio lentus]PMN68052.1 hypothetical protein BCT26_11535 [Vibrio lentus]